MLISKIISGGQTGEGRGEVIGRDGARPSRCAATGKMPVAPLSLKGKRR